MASTEAFVLYVCEQIREVGYIRYRKMFGSYMVYVNDKPILLVCDDVVFVKMLPEIETLMHDAEIGKPYNGAKDHYILDIDDGDLAVNVITILEPITAVPRPKKKKI